MAGVPVIVSDRGALPEAVSYKNEFIFKAGSFEGLENILKRFIENPKILNSIEILKHPITPQSYAESLFKRYLGLV
jgi:glycosyltransferase involved in cell wall biosynthesis